MAKAIVLFLAAGLAEIGGGYLGFPERTRNGIIASQPTCIFKDHSSIGYPIAFTLLVIFMEGWAT